MKFNVSKSFKKTDKLIEKKDKDIDMMIKYKFNISNKENIFHLQVAI
jgi:hypothetical protein